MPKMFGKMNALWQHVAKKARFSVLSTLMVVLLTKSQKMLSSKYD